MINKNKRNFYYLPGVYIPNTAATNRALSYIKAFSELHIKTHVIFFRPNEQFDEIKDEYKNITITNYWKHIYFKNKYFKYFSLLIYYILFICRLKKGDCVYCYGNAEIWSQIIKWRKGVKLYVEYTEHPEVTGIGGHFLTPSLNDFYKLIKRVDGLFVITTALRELFASKGVPQQKIHIANITVDTERFRNIVKTENIEPYIAYCGTVSNNKDGVDMLIKSFAQVVNRYPQIKLYIIGPVQKECDANENLRLIKDLNLSNSVILKGTVPFKEMPQILKDAKVLVLCRPDNLQAKHGFATKIGEYLMTENPVVLTAVGDFPLFFKNEENALLAEPDKPIAFAEKILWALDNEKKAIQIGKNGARLSEKEFSYLNVVKKLCKVMEIMR